MALGYTMALPTEDRYLQAKTEFEVYEDSKKEFRWRLKAANGNVVAGSSEGYKAKADCEKAVELVKKAGKAAVEDLTTKKE